MSLWNLSGFVELMSKYPGLKYVLAGGSMSRKTARAILRLDKWEMDNLYEDLLMVGGIVGLSTGAFKATPQAETFVLEKIKEEQV